MVKLALRVAALLVVFVALAASPGFAQGKGKPITLTARVVDAVCLLPGGLKGDSHRECAIGCDKAGVRMYLLDEKANTMYAVMAEAPFKDPNAPLREHLEKVVSVKGDLYTGPGGLKVVAVKEVKTAAASQPCAPKAQQPCAPKAKQPCGAKNPCAPKK